MSRDTAIRNTHPIVAVINGDTDARDKDGNPVTIDEAKIAKEMTRLQAEYDSQAYSRARVIAYPPIGDQLDALWKGGDDAEAMKAIVNKVKSDNPK
jgi:hypothetical protein